MNTLKQLKEKYYPDLPENPHPNHPYNKLSDVELRREMLHQDELDSKLGIPDAGENSRIASHILADRHRRKLNAK